MMMVDFNNPNEHWLHQGYDPYRGMTDDERKAIARAKLIGLIVGSLLAFAICALI